MFFRNINFPLILDHYLFSHVWVIVILSNWNCTRRLSFLIIIYIKSSDSKCNYIRCLICINLILFTFLHICNQLYILFSYIVVAEL